VPQDISAMKELMLGLLDGSYRSMHQAVNGLSDQQAYWQPMPQSNSIGWLVWHMMRRRDYYSAVCHGEPHVWVTGGWHERIGPDEVATGFADTPEQVYAFRPPFEAVVGYADACQLAAVDRVARLTSELLDGEYLLDAGRGVQSGWRTLRPMVNDGINHAGQIGYLRGMLTGFGWQAF